jgi:hypothetical protein
MHALVPWPASMQSASRQGMAYAAGEKAVALHNTAPHSMAQHVQRHLQSTMHTSKLECCDVGCEAVCFG